MQVNHGINPGLMWWEYGNNVTESQQLAGTGLNLCMQIISLNADHADYVYKMMMRDECDVSCVPMLM